MNRFKEKLKQEYPVLDMSKGITRNGQIVHLAELKNKRIYEDQGQEVPYIEDAAVYLTEKRGMPPRKLILIAENEVQALKTAAYIKENADSYLNSSLQFEFFMDEFDDDETSKLRVVSLKHRNSMEQIQTNRYLLLLDGINDESCVFFTGISGMDDIREKLDAISICPAERQFLWIHPGQFKMPWVQELLVDQQFEVLKLRTVCKNYYEGIIDYLLKNEEYRLSPEISAGMLVRKIRKKRGSLFKEEDLAWYMDQAAVHGNQYHPNEKVLRSSDFEGLELNDRNPMEQLNELVGISKVKEMVNEIAALVQEELHNEKLGTMHKSMLFLGNPGTGKTTCAELLADILAEEGDSNAVFITAARKDLIGEYVGQTAPKIAAKFEQARGGVLFVDEAGFMLNRNSGGYIDEAVKEFVRYMELYPDVTVIFAMYPHEAKEFLQMDAGLSSRISRFIEFEDYSDEELSEIAEKMLLKKGYQLENQAKTVMKEYMAIIRKEQKSQFGNAREVRRLVESAIVARSIEHYGKKNRILKITEADVRNGYERLEQKTLYSNKIFGFTTGGKNYVNQSNRL